MAKENYLEIMDLKKSFGGLQAISDLSCSIEKEKITSIIGPNGAGKTTLYNLITGFIKPDYGKVFYHGKDITSMTPAQIANLGVVRTFQNLRIFNKLTVKENIIVGLKETHQEGLMNGIFGLKSKEKKELLTKKAKKLIEFVGISKLENELAENISYGEQKFVILARTLAMDPDIILFDEPAAGVSKDSMEKMITLFRQLQEQGKTIVLVEHNMDVVMNVSDFIIVLNFGKKIASGSPKEVSQNKTVVDVYLGVS